MLKLKFFIPEGLETTESVKDIENLFNKNKFGKVYKQTINNVEGHNLKSQFLWSLSVCKKIKIKQTQKTKNLYPLLIVFNENDKPLTFYPQKRGKEEISIKDFLEGLSERKIICLHEKDDIEKELWVE